MDLLQEFLKERNEAFRKLDLAWARKMAPACSEDALLLSLHKARYECKQIEPELRYESRVWLESNGFKRMHNQPWPPIGELPQ